MINKIKNITGLVFSRLTVIDFSHIGNGRSAFWKCRCKRHNSIKGTKSLDQLPKEIAIKIKEAAESFRIAWSGGF